MLRTTVVLLSSVLLVACPKGGGGGADGGTDAGIVDVDFGIEERPSNATCLAPTRPSGGTGVALTDAYPSLPQLSRPILALQAPGDGSRWFIIEQPGRVKVFDDRVDVDAHTDFIDIVARVDSGPNEAGLLGMAFHPAWPTTPEVFLSYTADAGSTGLESRVSRFRSSDGGQTLDPSTEEILMQVEQPYGNHNGGHIVFGPDGLLYFGLGDGGSGGDPLNSGQDTTTLLGAILRIDVATTPYGIPTDNPFADGVGGRPEIYAWGLRNPWRFTFDRDTGELWAGDVGQNEIEEIDLIELGGNYGWNIREGTRCFSRDPCQSAGLIGPVVEYDHLQGRSVTGGYVYRGTDIPALVGTYVFGDFVSGAVWGVFYDDVTGDPEMRLLINSGLSISSFGEAADGELYILDHTGGRLHRFVSDDSPVANPLPSRLSETGCVDATNPTQPAAGMIPYSLNAPLWSDGADKDRWLSLPDGETLTVSADGDLEFPVGSVLMKRFRFGDRLVETRLFARHADGSWAGYSYRWNVAGTDADLLPAGLSEEVGGRRWTYPSRAQCLACHTLAAGSTLGVELAQLERRHVYPGGRRAEQLATLEHLGLFGAALPTLPRGPLPEYDSGAPVADRARAYLHSNCANCHRPGGTGQGSHDLRWTASDAEMGVCDAAPQHGELGATDARVVAPGAPERSVLSLRMHALDVNRMPPLGSEVVDEVGTGLVDDWIGGLTACP